MKADELLRQYAAGERYFRGVSLQGIYLRGVSLSGADLRWVDLSRASLMDVDLSQANLHGANLSSSNLLMANLSQACLSQANFTSAILIKADLSEASLHTTNFQRANLSLANLMGASHISTADLQKAILNGATMPDGNVFGKRIWWFRLPGVWESLNRNLISNRKDRLPRADEKAPLVARRIYRTGGEYRQCLKWGRRLKRRITSPHAAS